MNNNSDKHDPDGGQRSDGHRFIDSILHSVYGQDQDATESLVAKVMNQIEEEGSADDLHPPRVSKPAAKESGAGRGPSRFSMSRWGVIGLAVAVGLIIALVIPFNSPSQNAMATVRLSLDQALADVGRHYTLHSDFRANDGSRTQRESDLYVRGSDQFAIRRDAFLTRGNVWIGSSERKSWVVPSVGPILEGDPLSLNRWMNRRERLSTPLLHVSTILERMRDAYRLEMLPEVVLENEIGDSVRCRHITGVSKSPPEGNFPDRIELWADADTGVARRVEVSWDLDDGEAGRELLVIEFVGEPDLSDDWFAAEGHFDGRRRRLNFDSGVVK